MPRPLRIRIASRAERLRRGTASRPSPRRVLRSSMATSRPRQDESGRGPSVALGLAFAPRPLV